MDWFMSAAQSDDSLSWLGSSNPGTILHMPLSVTTPSTNITIRHQAFLFFSFCVFIKTFVAVTGAPFIRSSNSSFLCFPFLDVFFHRFSHALPLLSIICH